MGKRELVALLNLSSWCLVMVERLFLPMPRGCLRFVIVVFLDHTHLLFLALELNRSNDLFIEGTSCIDANGGGGEIIDTNQHNDCCCDILRRTMVTCPRITVY